MIYTDQVAGGGLSDAKRVEFARGHGALEESLAASGELIGSGGLADPSPPDPEPVAAVDDTLTLLLLCCHPCSPRRRRWL